MPRDDDQSSVPENADASRRNFLKSAAGGLLAGALAGTSYGFDGGSTDVSASAAAFQSRWPAGVERYWIGPAYWSNPLQDWRLSNGRLELISGGNDRNVHLLTRQLGEARGTLHMQVQVGQDARSPAGSGRAGFRIGITGPLNDYRDSVFRGSGLDAGIDSDGLLFIGDEAREQLSHTVDTSAGIVLQLAAEPSAGGYRLTLEAYEADRSTPIASVQHQGVPADRLVGSVALFADFEDEEDAQWGEPRLWFRDWQVGGSKVEAHERRALGPILFAQYTLSRGVMKMTAQMPPIGSEDEQHVQLQVKRGGGWETIGEEPIHELARTATFRLPDWDASQRVPYRLVYHLEDGDGRTEHHFHGTIQRDPVDKEELVVGGLSCETDFGFPHAQIVDGLYQQDPDLLFFTGDQLYEASGGYGVQRHRDNVELSTLDYLRKWYMHGWAFGDVMRDRPTVTITDDHDVYQGNIWGEGGKAAVPFEEHNDGGYFMPAEWVNMVQRTQAAHLPDPYDPTPIEQGITVYYTDMVYGRVSFAILEDRKWKNGPDGLVPETPGRPDHITDPDLDPATVDVPGAVLLGDRQMAFLDEWTADWRGADMKVVVSQSGLSQVPNLHGYDFMHLVADLDSNGWPQTPRNEALRVFRKGFAFHLGGDQHLPMLLRYGIDEWDDAGYNFGVPAISTGYPRAFEPERPGQNRQPGMPYYTGQYEDGLGNKVTVHAVANPVKEPREDVLQRLADKVSGYGILRLNTETRDITMEAWPVLSDPRRGDSEQYPGWPKTVNMEENYGRKAAAYLPTLVVNGATNPMVQVIDDASGEVVYTLRISGQRFRPKVFREGQYTIRVGDDEAWRRTVEGVTSLAPGDEQEHVVRI